MVFLGQCWELEPASTAAHLQRKIYSEAATRVHLPSLCLTPQRGSIVDLFTLWVREPIHLLLYLIVQKEPASV
jgi:hypothetical protein